MLVIENLHFAYKQGHVLLGVDIEAHGGDIVGVVGPNGAGKTTLLRLISGTLSPTAGSVRIDGADVGTLTPVQRARLVSVVLQNPQLPLSYSVFELVLMGRNPYLRLLQWEGRDDIEIVERVMELTDTWRLRDREVGSLSGGERQRTLVAMALAQETPVMLLDEPTASLDLAHQTGVMNLIRNVQRHRNGAIIVAMHDLTLAAQYCDRLLMLSEGRVYVEGTPEAVLTTENVSTVYGAEVFILQHPKAGRPVVLPVADGSGPGVDPT